MNSELLKISEDLRAGKPVAPITVRELMWMFSAQRRGYAIVNRINEELNALSLETFPNFETVWMDHPIAFILKSPESDQKDAPQESAGYVERAEADNEQIVGDSNLIISSFHSVDPIYRIGKFRSAKQKIISVKPDSQISECITLMLASDISQIPVMINERDVKGIVTWKSISSRLFLRNDAKYARDCMDSHQEASQDSSIFYAIPIIMSHDYVLIRSKDNKISGIVTASDMAFEFQGLTEPFLLLSEIEQTIRNLISSKFGDSDVVAIMKDDYEKNISGVSELTFGEYIRLIENENRWSRLNINIDRIVFCKKLENIREIRNDIMHFKFRGKDEDLQSLREFAGFIKYLTAVGI